MYISKGAPAQGEQLLPWFPAEVLVVGLWEHYGIGSVLLVQAFHVPKGNWYLLERLFDFDQLDLMTVGSNHSMMFSWCLCAHVHECLRVRADISEQKEQEARHRTRCVCVRRVCAECQSWSLTAFVLKQAHCSV